MNSSANPYLGGRMKAFFVSLAGCVLAFVSSLWAQDLVKEIKVVGNQRVQTETVLMNIRVTKGEPYDPEKVSESVKALYRTGYFYDVKVDKEETPEGIILTFILFERPQVKEVLISGYQKLKREELESAIKVKRGDFFDEALWEEGLKALKDLYASKGFWTASVQGDVEELPGNEVVLYVDIQEGPKGAIRGIRFEGNKAFSDRKLKKLMRTKEKDWLSWLTKSGTLNKEVLEADLARIRYFYQDQGYAEVKVSEPEITVSKDGRSLFLTVRIEEGRKYRVGSVDITGDPEEPKEKLLKAIKAKTRPGRLYRISEVTRDVFTLVDYYASKGYAHVDVVPLSSLDREKGEIHLVFKVEKGPKVYLGDITIKGNTKTRDKVIRREIKLAEGDLYNAKEIRQSLRRTKRLGIFKTVEFNTVPTSRQDVLDLEVKVDEMPTGAFQFGGGYSSLHGLVGMVALSERNLFGRGYRGYIKASLGAKMDQFSLGFTDPRFMDTFYSVGFDLFNELYDYTAYDYRLRGGDIAVGKELSDSVRIDFVYRHEKQKVFNVAEDASEYIKSQRGTTTLNKAILGLSHWTLDEPLFPTRGWDNSFSLTNAGGPLGGDSDFLRAEASLSWFKPIWGNLVLNLRGKFGIIEPYGKGNVPLGEKFFVGGMRTLRGFEYGMAGPVDENYEPKGSLKMAVLNFEFLYPLSKELGLRLALFYDMGKGFDKWQELFPLRHAVGVGLRWYSPLGPIRIDWGYNLDRKKGEKASVWDFAIGIMY